MNYQKEQQLRNCLARNLRYLRMSRSPCLSQKMLARKLGVTQKSISRYENAKYLPPAHVLVALADEFGLAMDELFMEHLPKNIKKKEGITTNEDITHSDPQEDCRREKQTDR
jgi:DNA-binding XRE family transcriptional regulator